VLERVGIEAVVVHRHGLEVDRMVAQDVQGEDVGRQLDEHGIARRGEPGQHLVEGERVAAGDGDLALGYVAALDRGDARGDQPAQLMRPFVGSVGQGRRASARKHRRARPADVGAGQERRVGLAEDKFDHAGARHVLGVIHGGSLPRRVASCVASVSRRSFW
jgi:hypothetical protein